MAAMMRYINSGLILGFISVSMVNNELKNLRLFRAYGTLIGDATFSNRCKSR